MIIQKKIFETFKNKILSSKLENIDNISDWLCSTYVSSLFENNVYVKKISISPLDSNSYKSFKIQATNKNIKNVCEIHIYKDLLDGISLKPNSLLIFDMKDYSLNESFLNFLSDYNFFISKNKQHFKIIVF